MFGFFKRKPTIELVDLEDGVARFKANQRLKLGVEVEAEVLLPNKHHYLVRVRGLEAHPDGLYSGKFGPADVAEIVAEDYARHTNLMYYKGDAEPTTHIRRYVIRGRDLPNYKGITSDLSIAKAKLELDRPMPLGETFEITLELDDQRLPQVGLSCEVLSCGPLPLGKSEVGVRWVVMDPRHASLLEGYLKRLKRRP